jgi:hypothetical protein
LIWIFLIMRFHIDRWIRPDNGEVGGSIPANPSCGDALATLDAYSHPTAKSITEHTSRILPNTINQNQRPPIPECFAYG